ncbi:MAG: hypothetical protein WC222_07245 [Parachlamydiales bacterium]
MSANKDQFKIYVDQLKSGHVEHVKEEFDPSFLEVNEPDLQFKGPVHVEGDAYVAGHELILHFVIKALSVVPCKVCNKSLEIEISLPNFYEAIPLSDVPHGIFSMQETLREAILLNITAFAECEGNCPRRQEIAPFLKKTSSASPFDQLSADDFKS